MKFYWGYLLILLGIIAGTLMVVDTIQMDTSTKIVDCYDRYGNEIIWEQCIDEYDPQEPIFLITMAFFIIIMFIMLGIVMINVQKLSEENSLGSYY